MRRRTQVVRPGYRDGGAVPQVAEVAAPADAAAAAPPEPAIPEETEEERAARIESEQRVLANLEAQKRAEELSRLPEAERELRARGMSMEEATFTLQHPEVLDPENVHIVAEAYRRGQQGHMRFKRSSPELFNYVLDELERHRAAAEGAERLEREAERERLVSAANAPAALPADPERPLPTVPPPRRGIPMAAPVSRNEVPTMSGKPRMSNTLTPAEREIAHNSFDADGRMGLTNAQREYMYLQQREKYKRMVASGEYDQQAGGRQ